MMTIIQVDALPPSNNKFIGRTNIWEYQQEKEKWHWLIKAALANHPNKNKTFERAEVTIVYTFKDKRRHDPDNYSGKFILDALVKEHILTDDDFEHIELHLAAMVDHAHPHTTIIVSEVEE